MHTKYIVYIYLFLRTVYLIIDGGYFYAHEYVVSDFVHKIFVPLSIFGEYYIGHSEKKYRGNRPVQRLSPSPYCRPEPVRSVSDPVGSSSAKTKYISIQIPEKGHEMVDEPESSDDTTTVC